eukprot:CAMPEP_0183484328 /NCGR_PEP_ID=MMETSP0370-20130417/178866_1 /TAXON_ID=268820 /ORGANISM="Peridinium aciculiferum, Strain PAER-2" /LENGTH=461 /DNA_ID=CAMNT_0025677619 /DNA_START=66 /DNA_END=1452 /DNA_ORIENTATION=-
MSCFDCFCGLFGAEDPKKKALKDAKAKLVEVIQAKSCGPILLRTAWHEAGTYDMANKSKGFPNAGGAIGSITTPHEITAPPNAGLKKALDVYLGPIKSELDAAVVVQRDLAIVRGVELSSALFFAMSCFDCFCGLFGAEDPKKKALKDAKAKLVEVIQAKSCGPILLRTAWHEAGTYDMANKSKGFPNAGGAIGSITTPHEITAPPNAGLKKALDVYLGPIKSELDAAGLHVSWADLIQLGGATAVECMGGPKIAMKYGRLDGIPTELAPPPFGLPDAFPEDPAAHVREVFYKYDNMTDEDIVALSGAHTVGPAAHVREVFYKYDNMTDEDIVALSGAHTVGRLFEDRSGAVKEASGGTNGTKYTKRGAPELMNHLTTGGRSWTKNWNVFDNSYYTDMDKNDPEVIYLPTDKVLMTDPSFRPITEKFAADQAAFFASYAKAHKKLSELGSKFEPADGISGV